MSDTMYSLAIEVAEGRLTAEEAAERMGKLGTWVSPKEYESDAAKASPTTYPSQVTTRSCVSPRFT